MKALIAIVVVVALIAGAWKIWDYWDTVNRERAAAAQEAEQPFNSGSFSGVPPQLERQLQEAQKNGPKALKQFLDRNRPLLKDPRLGALELDYVVSIARENPVEAKKIYAEVKKRTPPDSPLQKRLQSLAKTYE